MFSFMKKLNKLLPVESTLPGRANAVTVPDKAAILPMLPEADGGV